MSPSQTDGMQTDNNPTQEVRDVVGDRCKRCGRKSRDTRAGVCDVCAFPKKDIMIHGDRK